MTRRRAKLWGVLIVLVIVWARQPYEVADPPTLQRGDPTHNVPLRVPRVPVAPGPPEIAPDPERRVLVVGVDGCRLDVMEGAPAPTFHRLIATACTRPTRWCAPPAATGTRSRVRGGRRSSPASGRRSTA